MVKLESHNAEIKVWLSSGDQGPPPSPWVSGKTRFLVVVGLRSLLSWLLAEGRPWLLATTLRLWPHWSFLRLFTAEPFAARRDCGCFLPPTGAHLTGSGLLKRTSFLITPSQLIRDIGYMHNDHSMLAHSDKSCAHSREGDYTGGRDLGVNLQFCLSQC